MARKIIKKLGGDRLGSGNKMTVAAHGYGYSTHDISKIRRTSMSFGTIVPMNTILMTAGSKVRMNLDALITSSALDYQLYGSAKFQIDVFSSRLANYNPKMLINLNDQGYDISDIKFPQMELKCQNYDINKPSVNRQVNTSALLRYLGISGTGWTEGAASADVKRKFNAQELIMYYQTVKEYYANKQEKVGYMIHNVAAGTNMVIERIEIWDGATFMGEVPDSRTSGVYFEPNQMSGQATIKVYYRNNSESEAARIDKDTIYVYGNDGSGFDDSMTIAELCGENPLTDSQVGDNPRNRVISGVIWIPFPYQGMMEEIEFYRYSEVNDEPVEQRPRLQQYDLKAIDRMSMRIMANVESSDAILIDEDTELPYGASFREYGGYKSINGTQEGLCLGTYQSDVFNNWLDNETINNLNNKSKVKVNEEGEFSIDMLNITQKMYNYDMRIGITDGTLDEWRELTYGQATKGKSLKPVYEGGLSKEIVFDQVVSTAATDESPLGTIASRGQFGSKHKGGYVEIEADEEKIVMVLCKITPRIVYNQGNKWSTNLKTLEDLHKPVFDKIGYQDLITDTMASFDTEVKSDGTIVTKSAGKQPAWQWYRTDYDDALGNMAYEEDYKVFSREYTMARDGEGFKIGDLTTYIDPEKYNDVFAIDSLDAMHFDVQVGMDITATLVMSEEVIPNL